MFNPMQLNIESATVYKYRTKEKVYLDRIDFCTFAKNMKNAFFSHDQHILLFV